SGDPRAAQVEGAVPHLRLIVEPVALAAAGAEQVDDLVAARRQQLRNQPAVAAPPDGLGAHEAGRRPDELGLEGGLPVLRPHPCRVAPEGRNANAAEVLLAGLAAQALAEPDGMSVADAVNGERVGERSLVELRVPA